MDRINYFFIFIIFNQIYFVQSPIPSWELSSQSIDLFESKNKETILIFTGEYDGVTANLNKEITKSDNIITIKNKLTIGSTTIEVEFDDIDSFYTYKLGADILICPKGKFHPYDFKNQKYLNFESSGFEDKGDWDLRCYQHNEGCFFIFYLLNNGKNLFYKYKGDLQRKDYIYSYLYDYRLENGAHDKSDNFNYKFSLLRFQEDNNNNKYLILAPSVFIFNPDNGDVNFNTLDNNYYKIINLAKSHTQAYFNKNHKFFFFSYNDVTDFESGYSNSYVDFSGNDQYLNSIKNLDMAITQNSP